MFDLVLRNVTVTYGRVEALKDFTLEIMPGDFVGLLGPSGCGKTTTLRSIAGFIEPDCGDIVIKNKKVNGLPPFKRNLGFVFQNYALFPHMTAGENVAFGLTMMKISKDEINMRVRETLALLRLEDFEDRYPGELSGGQQQRIALARAIVIKPDVLLLDEPLGALDKKLREEMQIELKALQQRMGTTTVFVTHDQEEALSMSDKIVVMNDGEMQQIGPPDEIYEYPKNRFVSNFIGVSNFFDGFCVENSADYSKIEIASGEHILAQKSGFANGESCCVSVRPEKINLFNKRKPGYENAFSGIIVNVAYLGNLIHYLVKMPFGGTVKVFQQNKGDSSDSGRLEKETKVSVCWHANDTLVLK